MRFTEQSRYAFQILTAYVVRYPEMVKVSEISAETRQSLGGEIGGHCQIDATVRNSLLICWFRAPQTRESIDTRGRQVIIPDRLRGAGFSRAALIGNVQPHRAR